MSRVGFVRNSIYEKGLKKMARAWRNAVERRMSESRVRENLMHGLMRGGWNFHPPTLPGEDEKEFVDKNPWIYGHNKKKAKGFAIIHDIGRD